MLDAPKTVFFSQYLIDFISFGHKDINFIIITNRLKMHNNLFLGDFLLYTFLKKRIIFSLRKERESFFS